jgi:raffinose/stachyose/melibiose transport system substrate-binding protein
VGEERLDEFSVTYVPARDARKATDIIGGLSMGYYITQKAWDDAARREAAVSFVTALTTDEVVNRMAAGTSQTALSAKSEKPADLNSLQAKAFDMMMGATSVTAAVQDYIAPEAKDQILITDTKLVANGDVTAEDAVNNMIAVNG